MDDETTGREHYPALVTGMVLTGKEAARLNRLQEALEQITVSSRPNRTRVVATHPDDGRYWIKEVAFPEGQAVTLAEIVAEFEESNQLPRKVDRHG
jgi:hypothetical protein